LLVRQRTIKLPEKKPLKHMDNNENKKSKLITAKTPTKSAKVFRHSAIRTRALDQNVDNR
jgi:hypothetical protein